MEPKSLAILLAVYEPNEAWLAELLQSLNQQTYPNLRLYVRHDASPTYTAERLRQALEQNVTAFPWVLKENPRNMGSNKTSSALLPYTFEKRTLSLNADINLFTPPS